MNDGRSQGTKTEQKTTYSQSETQTNANTKSAATLKPAEKEESSSDDDEDTHIVRDTTKRKGPTDHKNHAFMKTLHQRNTSQSQDFTKTNI